ncbi:gamma-glutamyl-gamma-aminobutyrate hydrolase family protein [Oscillospiraceae bacterium OttesenSCG-928-F05]|nr:gamma-glutamyl-gamma-aminobutyrate hydrolase family protein [Oscillospiraceae bacterium OttesenSCG-928-F05]
MPLILISGSSRQNPRGGEDRLIRTYYPEALAAVGADSALYLAGGYDRCAEICDGLLLSGGVDVDPACYGEAVLNATVEIDLRRDREEFDLIRAFCLKKKPILGICRGMQVIAAAFGSTLWQDLPAQGHRSHADTAHTVTFEGGAHLGGAGDTVSVNSFHHQAVKSLAPVLVAEAFSEDGLCEAFHHRTLPVWGVQWHPERMAGPEAPDGGGMDALFRFFVERCRGGGEL